ncbi:MAG: hypothetical protein JSR24_23475 [Proteobacteria bacterium]|nr:hypothetical protein [Pseudomonadota bacterium]
MSWTDDGTNAEKFRTNDLALATVLCMQGYDTTRLVRKRQDRQEAEWEFDRDDRLDKVVIEYGAGTHQVEPRHFMANLQKVRKQLYGFLDGRQGPTRN